MNGPLLIQLSGSHFTRRRFGVAVALVLINEVNLRRAWLILGWVIVSVGSTPGCDTLFRYVASHPGRLSFLPAAGH